MKENNTGAVPELQTFYVLIHKQLMSEGSGHFYQGLCAVINCICTTCMHTSDIPHSCIRKLEIKLYLCMESTF